MKVRQEVFDTYWRFAASRQEIFYNRLYGVSPPYTDDPILAEYKFCNAYRILDRVSQYLVRDVIYCGNHSPKDVLFRITLFRLLNKIQTWVELEKRIGGISLSTFDPVRYTKILSEMNTAGPIYGNAFILCANKYYGYERKHENQLALLDHVFCTSDVSSRLIGAKTLQELYQELRCLPLLGDFMAYQLAIDYIYSDVFNFSENDFTVAGPGAKRGIAKCFVDTGILQDSEIIQYMVEQQDLEFERLGLQFRRIGNRPLQAIDCQNLFCETDKYCRVKFPQLLSNRTRIKTRYVPSGSKISYFFPPKWKIGCLYT